MSSKEALSPTSPPAQEPATVSQGGGCVACGAALTQARCAACGVAAQAGDYKVRRVIGRTPHSRVYLAQGPGGQVVALKELLFSQVPSTQELDAFEREARLLEALAHPRIPRLLRHFQQGEGASLRLYLAAEYIAGETLLERLSHHTFTEAEAADIGLQVLDILEYLHGRKPRILHRDLKPANLIRRPDGTLVLVDFGSARESARGATTGSTLVGTFGYMPLEQFGGTVDVTSDLYALGATLVHLLGGTPPADHFQPDRGLDLSHLEGISLRPWLRKLTASRPEDRYPNVAQARQALKGLRSSRPSAQVEPAPLARPSADAPAALARLAQQADEARQATAQARASRKQQERERQEKKAREHAERQAQLEDDRLSLMDFYRLSCPEYAAPARLPWVGFGTAILSYAVLIRVLAYAWGLSGLTVPLAVVIIAAMVLLVYAVLVVPPLLKAVRWRRTFRQLPFGLEGLGQLVHRADGEWRLFTRCSLRLVFRKTDEPPGAARLVKTARATALELIVDRANASLPRGARYPDFFNKARWSLQETTAEGYANWRTAQELLKLCDESLAPLQRELGLLQAVVIEPAEEQLRLPSKRR